MANFSMDSFTNATNLTIGKGDTADVLLVLSYIITIVINTISCPGLSQFSSTYW